MDSQNVTSKQMILLITIFRLTTVILYMPSLNLPPYNQDVWIMVMFSFFYTVLFGVPLLFLSNRFSNLSLIEYLEKILGKTFGKFIGFLYGLFFLLNSVNLATKQAKIIAINILSYTPNWLIILILAITSLYIALKGFKVIAWAGELIIPATIVSIIGLIILGIKNVHFASLLPILSDSTFYEINLGSLMLSLLSSDIFILAMGLPYLENKKDINKIFLKSKAYSIGLVTIIVIVTMGALGVEQSRHLNFPFLIYTRLINYPAVFERIDPIYTITWLSANIGKVLTYIYFSSMAFKEVLEKKDNKTILYIVVIIVTLITIYISNTITIVGYSQIINLFLIYSSLIFGFIIPLITVFVYFFRRKSLNDDIKIQNN